MTKQMRAFVLIAMIGCGPSQSPSQRTVPPVLTTPRTTNDWITELQTGDENRRIRAIKELSKIEKMNGRICFVVMDALKDDSQQVQTLAAITILSLRENSLPFFRDRYSNKSLSPDPDKSTPPKSPNPPKAPSVYLSPLDWIVYVNPRPIGRFLPMCQSYIKENDVAFQIVIIKALETYVECLPSNHDEVKSILSTVEQSPDAEVRTAASDVLARINKK
jgi:hypothetical protein